MATRKKTENRDGLKGAAQEVWLAGLGTFNLVGEQGGKIFKQLVKRGRGQQEANQEVMGGLKDRAQTLKEDAKEALGKVTAPIESGLASAMQRMGVPNRDEIVKLTHRVEELTRQVAKAKAASQPVPKASARPAKPKPKSKARRQEKSAPAGTV